MGGENTAVSAVSRCDNMPWRYHQTAPMYSILEIEQLRLCLAKRLRWSFCHRCAFGSESRKRPSATPSGHVEYVRKAEVRKKGANLSFALHGLSNMNWFQMKIRTNVSKCTLTKNVHKVSTSPVVCACTIPWEIWSVKIKSSTQQLRVHMNESF